MDFLIVLYRYVGFLWKRYGGFLARQLIFNAWNRYGGIPSEAKTRAFPSVFQASVGKLSPWHQLPGSKIEN